MYKAMSQGSELPSPETQSWGVRAITENSDPKGEGCRGVGVGLHPEGSLSLEVLVRDLQT